MINLGGKHASTRTQGNFNPSAYGIIAEWAKLGYLTEWRLERAAIMEFDGGLSREAAEEASWKWLRVYLNSSLRLS